MIPIDAAFCKFCVDTITTEGWGEKGPIPIAVLDRGMNPILQVIARKNSVGAWDWEEKPTQQSVSQPGPYMVRFTVEGKHILRDFRLAPR